MQPQDQVLLDALETQWRELSYLLDRMQAARSTLIPPTETLWRGAARRAYDASLARVEAIVTQGIGSLGGARDATERAIVEVRSRV